MLYSCAKIHGQDSVLFYILCSVLFRFHLIRNWYELGPQILDLAWHCYLSLWFFMSCFMCARFAIDIRQQDVVCLVLILVSLYEILIIVSIFEHVKPSEFVINSCRTLHFERASQRFIESPIESILRKLTEKSRR